MAIATNTILTTMEWAKRFNFNRTSGLGNSLEPALSSANIVMQTILSPPFEWWWNNQEFTFTCDSTPSESTTTGNIVVASNVLTLTVATPIPVGSIALLDGFTSAYGIANLNGTSIIILTNNGTTITANVNNLANETTADSGTVTAGTTQDYAVSIPNYSHIEHASVLDISKTPARWTELAVKNNLSLDSNTSRPEFISTHVEDSSGNITFRLLKAPNLDYPVSIHVQKTAPTLTSLNSTWAPIPDFMQYIYNWGFLAFMWLFADDNRAPLAQQHFVTHLLGRAEGLTEQQKNIFLNNYQDFTQAQILKLQQGTQARGV